MSKLNLKLVLSGAALLTLVSCVPIEPGYGSYNNSSYSQRLDRIPSNYQTTYHNGQRYHHHNGNYYRQRGNSYYRVDNPVRRHRDNDRYRDRDRYSSVTRGYDRHVVNGKTYYEKRGDWYVLRGSRLVRVAQPNRNSGNYGGVSTRGFDRHVVNGRLYYEKRGDWYVMRGNQLVRVNKPRR